MKLVGYFSKRHLLFGGADIADNPELRVMLRPPRGCALRGCWRCRPISPCARWTASRRTRTARGCQRAGGPSRCRRGHDETKGRNLLPLWKKGELPCDSASEPEAITQNLQLNRTSTRNYQPVFGFIDFSSDSSTAADTRGVHLFAHVRRHTPSAAHHHRGWRHRWLHSRVAA